MSIHTDTQTAQSLIKKQLQNLPVVVTATGLEFGDEITLQRLEKIGSVLLRTSRDCTLLMNFCLGDLYNALPSAKYGDKANLIRKMFGEGCYQRMKAYGRVARAWEQHRRRTGVCWQFYTLTAACDALKQTDYLLRYQAGVIALKQIAAEKRGGRDVSERINALVSELRELSQNDAYTRELILREVNIKLHLPASNFEPEDGVFCCDGISQTPFPSHFEEELAATANWRDRQNGGATGVNTNAGRVAL